METWPHHVWNPFIQVDWHFGIFYMPPSPIPISGQSFHIGAGIFYMPTVGLGEDKSNQNIVLCDGFPIVSRAHECKYAIFPHANIFWPVPGLNLLMPFLILGSASKCEFAVSSVRGPDGPIAVSLLKAVGFNWSCQGAGNASAYAPLSIVVNYSTVDIGFTLGDFVASMLCGLFDALKAIIESLVISWIAGRALKILDWIGRGLLKNQMKSLLRWLSRSGILGRWGGFQNTFNERATKTFVEIFFGSGSAQRGFSSLADAMNENILGTALTGLYGYLIGENFMGGALDSPELSGDPNATGNALFGLLTGSTVTGNDGVANRLGAWIDGNSEALGY